MWCNFYPTTKSELTESSRVIWSKKAFWVKLTTESKRELKWLTRETRGNFLTVPCQKIRFEKLKIRETTDSTVCGTGRKLLKSVIWVDAVAMVTIWLGFRHRGGQFEKARLSRGKTKLHETKPETVWWNCTIESDEFDVSSDVKWCDGGADDLPKESSIQWVR